VQVDGRVGGVLRTVSTDGLADPSSGNPRWLLGSVDADDPIASLIEPVVRFFVEAQLGRSAVILALKPVVWTFRCQTGSDYTRVCLEDYRQIWTLGSRRIVNQVELFIESIPPGGSEARLLTRALKREVSCCTSQSPVIAGCPNQ
jgi:hypothetical protein